jgi:hypothetical protein
VVLALRQPDAEGNLGCAEETHQVRVLGEEVGDSADPCGSECSVGKITAMIPSPTVRIAKVCFSLRAHTLHDDYPPCCDLLPSVTSSFFSSVLRKIVRVTLSPGAWSRRAPRRSP